MGIEGLLLWGGFIVVLLVAVVIMVVARKNPQGSFLKYLNRWYFYVPLLIIWLIVDVWIFGIIVGDYKTYQVPTSAMEDAIVPGDRVLGDLSAYDENGPEINDLVVFLFPGDGKTKYVKRCVAGPGDTVEIIDKKLFVNGVPEEEPSTLKYIDVLEDGTPNIQSRRVAGTASRDNFGPFVVPAECYFFMGDNRDNSYDSRFWGTVHRDAIEAKLVRVLWNPDLSRIGKRIE